MKTNLLAGAGIILPAIAHANPIIPSDAYINDVNFLEFTIDHRRCSDSE